MSRIISGKIHLAALALAVAVGAFWAVAPSVSAQTPIPSDTPAVAATPQPVEEPTATPPPPTSTPQTIEASPQDCQIRQGVQARLQSVLDTITREQDGHVEVSFRNPAANDCVVDSDLGVAVPTNIIISSQEGGSGTAGTVNFAISDIRPGLERSISMDFKCLRVGEYTINFSGSYWPSGDKSNYQPITLKQRLVCQEPSRPVPTDTPTPATPTPVSGGGESGGDGPNTTVIMAGVGLVFALIVIVAIVALGRKGK